MLYCCGASVMGCGCAPKGPAKKTEHVFEIQVPPLSLSSILKPCEGFRDRASHAKRAHRIVHCKERIDSSAHQHTSGDDACGMHTGGCLVTVRGEQVRPIRVAAGGEEAHVQKVKANAQADVACLRSLVELHHGFFRKRPFLIRGLRVSYDGDRECWTVKHEPHKRVLTLEHA